MRTKREMPLSEALEEISSTVRRLKEVGAARVNGSEIKLDEPVTLEIESEAKRGKAELEFDIKWPLGKSKGKVKSANHKAKGGGSRWFVLAVAGAALGAAALYISRRRRSSEDEFEDEF